jgi:hypothetical protein
MQHARWTSYTSSLRRQRGVIEHAPSPQNRSNQLAKTSKKRKRVAWTKKLHTELRKHSKARTPVTKISKQMKRTIGALRQQALKLGIGLGHQR